MAKVLESIPDEFAKGYMAGEIAKAKSFTVDVALFDICGGNMSVAIILSRILFWHRPNEKGQSRLRVKAEGHLWLAKNHDDWFEECRIKKTTARSCLKKLEEAKLIVTMVTGFKGLRTPHIRLNWEVFGKKLKAWASDNDEIEAEEVPESDSCQGVKWIPEQGLSAVIGALDVLTMTEQVSKSDRCKCQNLTDDTQNECESNDEQVSKSDRPCVRIRQTMCQNLTDHVSESDGSNTCRQHVDTCNTQEKEITSTKLSPVGDKSEKQDELVEAESELAPGDQTPESESDTEKVISEDEWIGTREAMVKAIAYTFDLQESYTGFPAMLRTQLEGTAKKGKRKEFALVENPATPSEVWGFGAWYKNRDLSAPTSAELLYERFEEFRSLNQYQKFQMIGEYKLRHLCHEEMRAAEGEDVPEAGEIVDELLKGIFEPHQERMRKARNPKNKAEWLESMGKRAVAHAD